MSQLDEHGTKYFIDQVLHRLTSLERRLEAQHTQLDAKAEKTRAELVSLRNEWKDFNYMLARELTELKTRQKGIVAIIGVVAGAIGAVATSWAKAVFF